ncbi:MAG: hypothetical protein J6S85_02200 [Methanobrevibacter sp.]|nr:hypothetical protein [Methanobrevibacter sp.]MBO7712349.1 hypothetical protein [Methanobrevibacter sp.]
MDIDIEKILKQAIIESFDEDRFIERLSMDIQESNPNWWVEKIVKPLRETLEKTILNNKDFIKEIICEILDREYPYDKIEQILEDEARNKLEYIMPRVRVEIDNDNTKD